MPEELARIFIYIYSLSLSFDIHSLINWLISPRFLSNWCDESVGLHWLGYSKKKKQQTKQGGLDFFYLTCENSIQINQIKALWKFQKIVLASYIPWKFHPSRDQNQDSLKKFHIIFSRLPLKIPLHISLTPGNSMLFLCSLIPLEIPYPQPPCLACYFLE